MNESLNLSDRDWLSKLGLKNIDPGSIGISKTRNPSWDDQSLVTARFIHNGKTYMSPEWFGDSEAAKRTIGRWLINMDSMVGVPVNTVPASKFKKGRTLGPNDESIAEKFRRVRNERLGITNPEEVNEFLSKEANDQMARLANIAAQQLNTYKAKNPLSLWPQTNQLPQIYQANELNVTFKKMREEAERLKQRREEERRREAERRERERPRPLIFMPPPEVIGMREKPAPPPAPAKPKVEYVEPSNTRDFCFD